jgi:hypothetical protein
MKSILRSSRRASPKADGGAKPAVQVAVCPVYTVQLSEVKGERSEFILPLTSSYLSPRLEKRNDASSFPYQPLAALIVAPRSSTCSTYSIVSRCTLDSDILRLYIDVQRHFVLFSLTGRKQRVSPITSRSLVGDATKPESF